MANPHKETKEIHTSQKTLIGKVVATSTPKTVVVLVSSVHRHPLYKKAVRRTKRFAVHNESLELKTGDAVKIGETKPQSRRKHFVVLEKVSQV